MPSDLIAVTFKDEDRAEEALGELATKQKEHLIELEDVVVARKDENGKVKLKQTMDITAGKGALGGTWWGLLIGLIFGLPLFGAVVGAASGGITGALTDLGVDDKFAKDVANNMGSRSSAIFVLVRKATPDKVLERVRAFGGEIHQTSLSNEAEARLQAALSEQQTVNV